MASFLGKPANHTCFQSFIHVPVKNFKCQSLLVTMMLLTGYRSDSRGILWIRGKEGMKSRASRKTKVSQGPKNSVSHGLVSISLMFKVSFNASTKRCSPSVSRTLEPQAWQLSPARATPAPQEMARFEILASKARSALCKRALKFC